MGGTEHEVCHEPQQHQRARPGQERQVLPGAFGLTIARVHEPEDKSFKLVFLEDENHYWRLELTWLRDHADKPYDLGENESHLGLVTDDYEAAHALHEKMGCICFENPSMGIYFVEDPDGYWVEVVPPDHR
mgnify:CR=1 FL=1